MTNQPDAAHKATFDAQMRDHQVAWRCIPGNNICPDHGSQNGHTRPWILPSANPSIIAWETLERI